MANRAKIAGICGVGLAILGIAVGVGWKGDPVIATYNGGQIRHSELVQAMESEFGAEMLQELLTKRLIDAAVKKHNLIPSEVELELWIEDYKQQPEIQEVIAAGQLDVGKLREHLRTTVPLYYLAILDIPEKDREKYFETHRAEFEQMELAHIMLGSESEARQLRERITGPDSFATMAIVHSMDDRNRDFAGALGRVTRAELEESFGSDTTQALFKIPVGQISRPVQSTSGAWHLFLVKSRSLDYQSLKRRVVEVMAQQNLAKYMEKMRDASNINITWQPPQVSPTATPTTTTSPTAAVATPSASTTPPSPGTSASPTATKKATSDISPGKSSSATLGGAEATKSGTAVMPTVSNDENENSN